MASSETDCRSHSSTLSLLCQAFARRAADPCDPPAGVEGPGLQESGLGYDGSHQLLWRRGVGNELRQEQDLRKAVEGHSGPESVRWEVVHNFVDSVITCMIFPEAEQRLESCTLQEFRCGFLHWRGFCRHACPQDETFVAHVSTVSAPRLVGSIPAAIEGPGLVGHGGLVYLTEPCSLCGGCGNLPSLVGPRVDGGCRCCRGCRQQPGPYGFQQLSGLQPCVQPHGAVDRAQLL
eukprot:5947120-Heterocapsa_arctica.AAC.1